MFLGYFCFWIYAHSCWFPLAVLPWATHFFELQCCKLHIAPAEASLMLNAVERLFYMPGTASLTLYDQYGILPHCIRLLMHVKVTSCAFSSYPFGRTTTMNKHCSHILLLNIYWKCLCSFTEEKLDFRTYLNCCLEGKNANKIKIIPVYVMMRCDKKKKNIIPAAQRKLLMEAGDDYLFQICIRSIWKS